MKKKVLKIDFQVRVAIIPVPAVKSLFIMGREASDQLHIPTRNNKILTKFQVLEPTLLNLKKKESSRD